MKRKGVRKRNNPPNNVKLISLSDSAANLFKILHEMYSHPIELTARIMTRTIILNNAVNLIFLFKQNNLVTVDVKINSFLYMNCYKWFCLKSFLEENANINTNFHYNFP